MTTVPFSARPRPANAAEDILDDDDEAQDAAVEHSAADEDAALTAFASDEASAMTPRATPDVTAEASRAKVDLSTETPRAKVDTLQPKAKPLSAAARPVPAVARVDTPPEHRRRAPLVIAVVVILTGGTAAGAFWAYGGSLAALTSSAGSLRVESDPAGAEVRVDGTLRGTTPLTLSLPAGPHQLVLQQGARTKTVAVTIAARSETVHHIDLPAAPVAPAVAVATGSLQIITEPARATVLVDGVERGLSPLTLTDLAVGERQVVVRSPGTTHRRAVRIEAGVMASLVITGAPAGAVSGWMTVPSPLPLQIFEGGRLIGTTESDRIMLAVGTHQFELVNEAVGFRAGRSVTVTAGETTRVSMALPRAPVSVNAVPWAEVWIDGERVGETPIGNVMQSVGPHEVVFRHPQLGEKKMNVMVTLKDSARFSVDMRSR